MLEFIRKKMKVTLIVIIALTVPALIFFFGVGGGRRIEETGIAATVNGEEISFRELEWAYRQLEDRELALERLIDEVVLNQEVRRQGIRVSNEEVSLEIKAHPAFQREGKFDSELYHLRVADTKVFEDNIRQMLGRRKLIEKVTAEVELSEEELWEEFRRRNERIAVDYIAFRTADYREKIEITDADISSYFEEKREDFYTLEKAIIDYITINPDPAAVEIREEEILHYYEENIDRFKVNDETIPLEKIRAEIETILRQERAQFLARREARKLSWQLLMENDWELMAIEGKFEIKTTEVFYGREHVEKIGRAPELLREAFLLEKGEVSNFIEVPGGYLIFILRDRQPRRLKLLEEVKEEVADAVVEKKARELAANFAKTHYEKIKEKGWDEIIIEKGIEVENTGPFLRGGFIMGIGFSEEFSETAFSLAAGEISKVVEIPAGNVILKGGEIEAAHRERFTEEKDTLRESFLLRKQFEAYLIWLDSLKQDAKIWIDPWLKERL
ncbi:MAG: Peptidyl-prolyl cis-trans isomerase D [Syntrophomonadaceae bacterium]|nr:Peptidyl-prolyl cis-trans isomerase D [Bacillota bacterium]